MSKKKKVNEYGDPRKIIIAGVLIILVFFGGLGSWAALFEISGAVIAPGEVRVDTDRKTVQHLEGGIVDEILVRDGDLVDKGDVLVRLKGEQVSSSVTMYRGQLDSRLAMDARLEAEKSLADSIVWPEELLARRGDVNVASLMAAEEKIFASKRDSLESQISLLKTQMEQINEQLIGDKEQIRAEEAILASLKEELVAKRELFEGRYIEKSRILELERNFSSHEGRRGELLSKSAQLRERLAELELRITGIKREFVKEASAELAQVRQSVFDLRERLRPLKDAKTRLEVLAPVSGIAVNLQVHSVDGVVAPGSPIVDIVPEGSPLILECKIQVQDITHVFLGQEAEVQLVAFKARTTPTVRGKVTYISADRLQMRTSYGEQPYYQVQVELDKDELTGNGLYLTPGMPAQVFITTKERTVLDYLLEPLLENLTHAMRE